MLRPLLTSSIVAAAALSGCSSSDSAATPPDGIACSSSSAASDAASLRQALAGAAAGTCVVVQAGEIAGSFTVGAGVTLAGARGSQPLLVADGADFVVKLASGATLANVRIDGKGVARTGISIEAATATVSDVEVTGAKRGIDAVSAGGQLEQGSIELVNVALRKNGVGLVASRRQITMRNGTVSENGGTALSSGYGIVASDDAVLELDGVTIEKNDLVGLLVDGPRTRAVVRSSKVLDNGGRGVWVQRVEGTLETPALRIEGTEVARNKVVGVGAFESRGIIIVGGSVGHTVAAPVVTTLAKTEPVGDGIGIFGGSGDVKIENATLEGNARAAGIIDNPATDRGIIIVGGKVGAGPSGLKLVVQNSTSAMVQIADTDRSAPAEPLGISAQKIPIPAP